MLPQENKIVFLKGHGERTHPQYALLQLFCKKKGSHHAHELFSIMPELLIKENKRVHSKQKHYKNHYLIKKIKHRPFVK